MKQIIYKFIFCTIFGWKVVGTITPVVKKCIIIAVPHTSWYDFFLGIFSRAILNIEINFVAKKELFVFSGPTNLTSIRPIQHSACQKDVSGMEKNTLA